VFEASARHLSLKKASQELNVTPGAVSKQIKLLEREAGTALFLRGHRSVQLTQHGAALLESITSGFGEIAQEFQRIKLDVAGSSSITLGSTTAFAQLWLMPRLGAFWRAHQDITINHLLSDTREDVPWGRVDLHVRYGTGTWDGERAVRLFEDRIYPVCSPEFARQNTCVSATDLMRHPLLHLQGVDPTWTTWSEWLKIAGVRPKALKTRVFSNYFVALQAAQDGQGIALGWHRLIAPLVKARRLVVCGGISIEAPHAYYLTWSERHSLPRSASVLVEWLLETAKAEPQSISLA